MHLIIGGDKPQNVREFTEQFVEALLTFWIARFGLSQDILPSLVIDVMSRLEEFLEHPNASAPSISDTPATLAMKFDESHVLDRYIVNGDPITSEKLAVIAENTAMAIAAGNWMFGEVMRSFDGPMGTDEG